VNKLHMEPSIATSAITFAMGVIAGHSRGYEAALAQLSAEQARLAQEHQAKQNARMLPIAQIRYQMVAWRQDEDGLYPDFFDERKPGPFKDDDAFVVMPLGRLLDALATEMQEFARLKSSKKAHVKMTADQVAQDEAIDARSGRAKQVA